MAPKRRKGGAGGTKASAAKKVKKEEPLPAEDDAHTAMKKLKETSGTTKRKAISVDKHFTLPGGEVVDDFDCMLNQTNIGDNNNKYYVIQLIKISGDYYVWNRWGRVGETGQSASRAYTDLSAAEKDFRKKFQDKTKNKWENRASFNPIKGKYTLLEMDDDDGDDNEMSKKLDALSKASDSIAVNLSTAPSKLDLVTQKFVDLIFSQNMFNDTLKSFDIDVKKMPLGKLSKAQIALGFEALEEIEKVLNKNKSGNLTELTSLFYTRIPHAFGRQRPPIINTAEALRKKMDMLMVLADIEFTQCMQKDKKSGKPSSTMTIPHPLDVNYELLQTNLELLPKSNKEYKIIEKYLNNTMGYFKLELEHVWRVNRIGEDKRFDVHKNLGNRKLLWHGTSVAVVAAILKSGLRIMPHSGGRVGKGIYFASENGKSAGYVGRNGHTGIMFLNEVALGNEYTITVDNSSLVKAPAKFDSVVARGRTEPNPKDDTVLTIDKQNLVVPAGAPVPTKHSSSSFSQSEYLIYKESQNRIRFMLQLKWP